MAKDKKTIQFYTDWHETFKALDNETAGKLIKHMFSFVNDEDPVSEDQLINLLFIPFKATFERDLVKWKEMVKKRSGAGKASSEARKLQGSQLYVLECWNNSERFIKVGVTDLSITRRYSSASGGSVKMPYSYKVLAQSIFNKGGENTNKMEREINDTFKSYKPKIHFGGHTECYNIKDKDLIINQVSISTSVNTFQQEPTKSTDRDRDRDRDRDTDTDTDTDKVTVKKKQTKPVKKALPVPSLEEFIAHAKERKANVNPEDVRLKYFSWKDNDWSITRDNKTRPILNWKSTLTNTVKFLGVVAITEKVANLADPLTQQEANEKRLAEKKRTM